MSLQIKNALIRGFFLRKTIETIRCWNKTAFMEVERLIGKTARFFFALNTPVDKKQIMFITFQGDYTCNPKYITEALLSENIDCNIVWSLRHASMLKTSSLDNRIRCVEVYTPEFYQEIMRSKIIVANSVEFLKQPTYLKPSQILIETWHGSLGIKKFGKENNSGKSWVRAAKICGKRANYIISNSAFENNVYRTTFWPKTEILQYGHPRNDVFFYPDKILAMKEKIYNKYNIPRESHIFLYAPTFRDDKKFFCYKFDIEKLKHALEEKFGGRWVIGIRFHPTVRKSKDAKSFFSSKNVINLTSYPDIQDLLLISDAAMTDYSSWIYDFLLTKRPGFIYAQDIDKYYNERGFYFSLYDTPFSVATNNTELIENIMQFDPVVYQSNVQKFLEEKGCIEDGNASLRMAKKIKELLK